MGPDENSVFVRKSTHAFWKKARDLKKAKNTTDTRFALGSVLNESSHGTLLDVLPSSDEERLVTFRNK